MTRFPQAVPLLVALVAALAVALPAAALPAMSGQQGQITPAEPAATDTVVGATNQTNYVMPPSDAPVREDFARVDIDVAGATAASAERLHGRYERSVFRRRWAGKSEAVQRRLVEQDLARLRATVDALERKEQAALTAFERRAISTGTFLRQIALVHVRAEEVSQRLDTVTRQLSISTQEPYIIEYRTPIDNIRGELLTLESPVSAVVNQSLAGKRDPATIYLLAGPNTSLMGTVSDGQFVRVVHVGANVVSNGTDQFGASGDRLGATVDRFRELYPWANANRLQFPSFNRFGNTSLHRVRVLHPQGNLQIFLDGRTTNVYHEIQVLRPEALPNRQTLTNETDALVLTVNTTTPTKTMRIEVDQAGTQAPLSGTVRIDGTVVGQTGDDGVLWTVQPRGQFTVNVTVDNQTVAVAGP